MMIHDLFPRTLYTLPFLRKQSLPGGSSAGGFLHTRKQASWILAFQGTKYVLLVSHPYSGRDLFRVHVPQLLPPRDLCEKIVAHLSWSIGKAPMGGKSHIGRDTEISTYYLTRLHQFTSFFYWYLFWKSYDFCKFEM